MSDFNNDPLLGMDINKTVQLIQNEGPTVSSASPLKSKAPKKRTRRRYVYSKPKKRKKKKDVCENLIDTVSFPTIGLLCESKDKSNHSDCSSDTIIDDREDIHKDGVNIGNEFPNSLPEDEKLPPPELGKLLISDGMLLSETKRKKGAKGKSRARNNKSKGNQSKKIQPEFINKTDNPPVLSIKYEPAETSELPALPVKESVNIISEKKVAFPGDFQNPTNFFSASDDVAVPESKKRKPQTARRGKKKQNSNDRSIVQQPKNNSLAFDDYPIDQSLLNTKEINSISSVFESSMTEISKAKMTTPKKRSPAKRNRSNQISAISDFSNNDVSSFLTLSFSNTLEQNNLSCHPTNPSLIENEQNSKRKRTSPNMKNTSKRNSKSLDSLKAYNNANAYSFPPLEKKKGSSPRKGAAKKSIDNIEKESDIVERQCSIKSDLVISIKKELSDNFVINHEKGNTEEFVSLDDSIDKLFLNPNTGNLTPSSKQGISKTYVSMSFEEDTSVVDETNEHISYLLSLGSKKSKNIKDTEYFKNPSKISANNSDANLKTSSNSSSSNAIVQSSLQPDNLVGKILDKGITESGCLLQLNASHTIDSNIPNIKKGAQHFCNNSIEMCSVDKMSSESVNRSNTMESSKSLASDSLGSNTGTQRVIQNEFSNIHTFPNFDNFVANAEKLSTLDIIKKEPIDLQENESPDKSISKSESLHQLNASHSIDSNIPTIKKEAEHFSDNSVEMFSVDKMSSESMNRNNTVECSESLASDLLSSNIATQKIFQPVSSIIHTSQNSDNSDVNAKENTISNFIKKEPGGLQKNESAILRGILLNVEKLQKKVNETRATDSLNELAISCLNQDLSGSPVLNSSITELSSDDNNSKTHEVAIPQFRTSSESNSRNNSDILNNSAINSESIQNKTCDLPSRTSESIQGKTCELPSVILSYDQIKREPEEALPDMINKTKNSTLEVQTLYNQGNERNSSGSILEGLCLSNERETPSSVLNVDKRQNIEKSQHTSQFQNESTFVETRPLPTSCAANAAFKRQDNSLLKEKETSELTCNNFLSINIKKERLEIIKNTSNVNEEPSTISPVSAFELSENNTSTETLPMSDSINAFTIQSLENNICNNDKAIPSTSQTCSDGCSNCISTTVASFKSGLCNDSVLSHDKSINTTVTKCISSTSSEQSSLDLEVLQVGMASTLAAVTSNLSSSINSNQSMAVSDLLKPDAEKSFVSSITSANKKKIAENSSESTSNSTISDSFHLKSKNNNDLEDNLILISDDSSSDSCSIIFSSGSDDESMHSLGDLEGPSRKKIYVNLSTGEIINENNDLETTMQADDSFKNLLDLNKSEFTHRNSLKEYIKCIDNHIARAKMLEKEKNLNLLVVESEVTAEHNISSVSEQNDISNQTSVCDTLINSRSVTPNNIAAPFQCSSPINLSSPVHEVMENSLDISDSISSEEFDLLANFKKNSLKFRKHPYPGDVPFYKRKPYTGCYFRYDEEISDITVEDVEKKLKEVEKAEMQAPEDPADGRKLDFNSLIIEEVDCYHRVLTAAPSKTLISKYLQESTVSARICNSLDEDTCLLNPSSIEDNASSVSEKVFADTTSGRNCNPVDDVLCIFSSPSIENSVSSIFGVPAKVSTDKNAFTSLSEQDKEDSIFTSGAVFQKETVNSLSKNVKKSQHLKPSCNNANFPEVSEISNKLQTDSHENTTKGPETFSKINSVTEQINLFPSVTAVKVSACTNIYPSNNSVESNENVLYNEMSEGTLSRIDDNMLGNEKNLSTSVQKVSSANFLHEKLLPNMTPNELTSMIDKTDSFISYSGNMNDESSKEIPCDSNNSILPMEHCSVINSIHEESFSEFNVVHSVKQSSSNLIAFTSQLSKSSDHPKLLLIPGISENATSESSINTQIEEQSSMSSSSLQVNELCHSEMDDNSQTSPSVSNTVTDSLLSNLNLPTSELRKILETVNVLPSSECSKPNLLNFKETYQYDHSRYSYVSPHHVVDYGHGIPMTHHGKEYSYYDREPLIKFPIVHDYDHKSAEDLDIGNLDACNKGTVSTTVKARHEASENTATCSKSDLTPENNEDNFNNNIELSVESSYGQQPKGFEQKDEMKESATQDQDVPNVKPQYKSRFQRVMERVSSKKSSKAEPSDLLTDCFPLKSSKEKPCIRKPIALVQPCNQKVTKNPSKQKNVPLNNNPLSLGNSKNNKMKKCKKKKSVSKSKKSPPRNKSIRDSSTLFQPDRIVKAGAKEKSVCRSNSIKSNESPGNRVYGRVTNRGSFLTQSSINQPPKPKESIGKKSINMMKITKLPSDELHSMIHSPKIDIIPTKNIPTCSDEFYKSVNRIGGSASFIASASKTTISTKTSFNSTSSFLKSLLPNPVIRPPLTDPRTILKSVSPDITCQSPNDSSNFLINPNLPTIFSNVPSKKSCLPCNSPLLPNPEIKPESPQTSRRTLLPTPQIGFNQRDTDNEGWFTSIHAHTQNYSNLYRSIPVTDLESSVFPLTNDSPSVSGSSINFNVQPSSSTEQSSPSISSDAHISNRSAHHRHSRTRQTKCVCLPPKSLKASVGNAVFDTADVLLLILEWNVDWLVQQQKNHDPPPISTYIRKVINTYEDFDEYYNTYLPLMLLETWHRIYMSWTSLNQAASPYFCEVTSYSVETHSIRVQCQAIFKNSDAERGLVPEEGNIIMVKFGTKQKGGIKILGYIRDVKIVPFDTSVNVPFKCLKYTSGENSQMLLLTFSGAYSSDDFDINQLIRIQILYNIKSTLKQNDALLNLKNSPLYKNILNPLTDGLRVVTLKIRNPDTLQDNTSECVRDIIKGILSPHPLPLLTVAKTLFTFDHYLILPSLIEMMKNSYRTKVLLCTRTSKALTDMGTTLCGTSIKFVVLGKRTDIHQKYRKYLLEEVANKKLSKESSEDAPINEDTRNSLLVNIKLEILRNCDVILSLVRNCHNELVAQAFADGDSIAQMCCIIDEASVCTEPEILTPLLYGISKLILIGDSDVPAKVCSKAASNYGYNRSLFHRAYELDLASE